MNSTYAGCWRLRDGRMLLLVEYQQGTSHVVYLFTGNTVDELREAAAQPTAKTARHLSKVAAAKITAVEIEVIECFYLGSREVAYYLQDSPVLRRILGMLGAKSIVIPQP